MIKIGVSGACGKMGSRIRALVKEDEMCEVVFGLERSDHPCVDSQAEGDRIVSDADIIKECDCLIEFSAPDTTVGHLAALTKYKKAAVIGTTGLTSQQQEKIIEASRVIPIVFSPNMSVGVNVVFRLLKEAARILKGYGVYVEEAHHIHKKDAPSGTAKKIAQIINEEGFSVNIDDIVAIREDEIVGDHSVVFKSDVDEIEISHSAKTRDIFAQGAVVAAKWIAKMPAKLYSMDDVLFGS